MSAFYNVVFDVLYHVFYAYGWMVKTSWTGAVRGGALAQANAQLSVHLAAGSVASDLTYPIGTAVLILVVIAVIHVIYGLVKKEEEPESN